MSTGLMLVSPAGPSMSTMFFQPMNTTVWEFSSTTRSVVKAPAPPIEPSRLKSASYTYWVPVAMRSSR